MEKVKLCLLVLLFQVSLSAAGPADPGYVGSKVCFGCHSDIYRTYAKTAMARSMRPAAELTAVPESASVAAPDRKRMFQVTYNSEGWSQVETEPGVFRTEQKLAYIVGSGANGLTFLVQRGNFLFQAPLSFYTKVGKWDLSPGFEAADLGFNRPIAAQCISCHSGRPHPVTNHRGEFQTPPFRELPIGCESCHGPGESHVMVSGKKAGPIVNPAKLPPRLAENICMNCHQTGDTRVLQPGKTFQDFRPGQWLVNTVAIFKAPASNQPGQESDLLQHSSAMQASRCFQMSADKLSCLTCHDPHVEPAPAEAASYFRAKCLKCHNLQSCRAPLTLRRSSDPPDNCISCHMPKRSLTEVSHSALTNHRIPARAAEPAPVPDKNPAGSLVLVDQPPGQPANIPDSTLLRAYGEVAADAPEYQARYLSLLDHLRTIAQNDPVVQQALGHKALIESQYEEAVSHFTAALSLDDAAIYKELSEALSRLGRESEAVTYLQKAAEIEPFDAVTQKKLILIYIGLKRYSEAQAAMTRYVDAFPEDAFMREMLARVSK